MSEPHRQITEIDRTALKNWAYQRRSEMSAILRKMKVGDPKDAVEELIKRLGTLESSMLSEEVDPMTAWSAFIDYLDEKDSGGWSFYLEKQAILDKELEETRRKEAIERFAALAATKAVQFRKGHAGGPGSTVGTVVAGLANVEDGSSWVGTSGVSLHKYASHPVMAKLLANTHQAEDWPVEACAEVDAMKQYLHQANITSVDQIPKGALFFHAETWDDRKRVWKGRSACANCSQWFEKIGAKRV